MTRQRLTAPVRRVTALAAILLTFTAAPLDAAPTERETYIYYSVSHFGPQDTEGVNTTDIWRAKLDGSNRELLVEGLYGVALQNQFDVDPAHGHLYYRNSLAYEDGGAPGIYRSDLRGLGRERWLAGEFASFVVDEQEGLLYYSSLADGLYRRDLNNLNDSETIFDHPVVYSLLQIVLDRSNNRVFGSDSEDLLWAALTTITKDISNLGVEWGATYYHIPSGPDDSNILPPEFPFVDHIMTGLAYDERDQTLYWIPWNYGGTPILSYSVGSGDDVEVILESDFNNLGRIGLFLDQAEDKLYFGDDRGNLKRVGLDGLGEETFFDLGVDYSSPPFSRVTDIEIVTIPEPATGLLLLGGGALLCRRWRSLRA